MYNGVTWLSDWEPRLAAAATVEVAGAELVAVAGEGLVRLPVLSCDNGCLQMNNLLAYPKTRRDSNQPVSAPRR